MFTPKNSIVKRIITKIENGDFILDMNKSPKYQDYTCVEDYKRDKIKFCVPMTAKDIESEEDQNRLLEDPNYYVEEKFDGTRATLHFFTDGARCFSRRISDKTGWFCENSDSVPHLRDILVPRLSETILDGEMFIPDRPFKDVSSTLNCKYDKAIARQEEIGCIVFHAFDILYYRGINIQVLPLYKRKKFLEGAIKEINSPYIKSVPFYQGRVPIPEKLSSFILQNGANKIHPSSFATLYKEIHDNCTTLSHKAYYEYIVMFGGEGVILKDIYGKYYPKRGREYQKIKKFLTRDVFITRFTEPTKLYAGKNPNKWEYWFFDKTGERVRINTSSPSECSNIPNMLKLGYVPVTKFWYEKQVGNIVFSVFITKAEEESLLKQKGKTFNITPFDEEKSILEVGECAGFDEEQRDKFTRNRAGYMFSVIEVKANEIFSDTGKLRHPRFLRERFDKDFLSCTWKDHIGG